jgi:hypothetical protein
MTDNTAKEIIDYLKSISPSGVELEFLTLGATEDLTKMMEIFMTVIENEKEFDFTMALLNNFLNNHNDLIILEECLTKQMSALNS